MLKVKEVDCMGKKWLDAVADGLHHHEAMEPEYEAYRDLFERGM